MNKKEIAYKLIELYFTNIKIFKDYCVSLNDLFERYNEMLKKLEGDSNEN